MIREEYFFRKRGKIQDTPRLKIICIIAWQNLRKRTQECELHTRTTWKRKIQNNMKGLCAWQSVIENTPGPKYFQNRTKNDVWNHARSCLQEISCYGLQSCKLNAVQRMPKVRNSFEPRFDSTVFSDFN